MDQDYKNFLERCESIKVLHRIYSGIELSVKRALEKEDQIEIGDLWYTKDQKKEKYKTYTLVKDMPYEVIGICSETVTLKIYPTTPLGISCTGTYSRRSFKDFGPDKEVEFVKYKDLNKK